MKVPQKIIRTALAFMIAAAFFCCCAYAGKNAVSPLPAEKFTDPPSGRFGLEITQVGKPSEGCFTAELYDTPVFGAEDVESLREGDKVNLGDAVWTVKDVIPREDGSLEITVVEPEFTEGYFAFLPGGDGQTYACVLADDIPARRFVGKTVVKPPLPEGFVFADGGNEYSAEVFLKSLPKIAADSAEDGAGEPETGEPDEKFTRYDTVAVFEDGGLVRVEHR